MTRYFLLLLFIINISTTYSQKNNEVDTLFELVQIDEAIDEIFEDTKSNFKVVLTENKLDTLKYQELLNKEFLKFKNSVTKRIRKQYIKNYSKTEITNFIKIVKKGGQRGHIFEKINFFIEIKKAVIIPKERIIKKIEKEIIL
ncbi:hypothetical protein [Flavobacterium sp.]|jgi:hypothetical protein|uniref:hypothetical protein n=1 Tax=Flavobacterium sp. TaxID=239 RepID=UPI002A83C7C7|nr:hypothetical protein [Flavobacterium sp.]